MAKTRKNATQTAKAKTYDAGRDRRVTVPETPSPAQVVADAIRDAMGPDAVAYIASQVRAGLDRQPPLDQEAADQVRWFALLLERMGPAARLDHQAGNAGPPPAALATGRLAMDRNVRSETALVRRVQ